jgi:SGNH domain (fused to AT3 domains)
VSAHTPIRLALVILLLAVAPAAADPFSPRLWPDAADLPGDLLDIRAVAFGQRDTRLWLTVRTAGVWRAGRVCLVAGRRLCVDASGRLTPAVPGAQVSRHGRTLRVAFHPRAARIAFGGVGWFVGAYGASGADRAPDRGEHVARVGPLGEPPCFGAAARPGRRSCLASSLARAVTPTPDQGYLMPDGPCRPLPAPGYAVLRPCAFGDLAAARAPAAAVIGDSHARVLRGALEVVAQARGWRVVSLTHPGCAFSTEVSASPDGIPAGCRVHGEEALAWLRAHPSVHAVFTADLTGRGFGPAGFAAMWARVPSSVRRIYVIRDVPHMRLSTADCVARVIRRHARPWRACAVPRATALPPDPAAEAGGSRVRVIDLTRHFCDAARCYPVVGGVYAYKDADHVNRVFSTTLGPYLLRRL